MAALGSSCMHEHKFAHILRVGNTIVASPVLLYASPASAEISRPDLRNIEGETAAVASVTTVDKLANDMAEAILSGEFAPGYRLDEQLLAQRYNVSRTPVREALRQLATTGLIEIRPRRGAIVAQVTPAQLEELFVAMAELEATCARLAAMSMSPMERRRLQALHERMGDPARQRDAKVFADDNHLLHTMIYAGAHNNVLEELATAMRRRLSPFRRAQFQLEGRPPRSFAEHDAVVTAIVAGNPGAAHAAMLHHVTLIEQSYEELSKPVL